MKDPWCFPSPAAQPPNLEGKYNPLTLQNRFLDRFRTAVNVSGDMFAARIVEHITGIKDDPDAISDEEEGQIRDNIRENSQRV